MRQKVLAYTLFEGKKPYNVGRRFDADYLEDPNNPYKDAYVKSMARLFAKFGDQSVEFADYADKVNRAGATQHRGIVITNLNIYKHDPKKFTVKQEGIPVAICKSISMSRHKDGFCVVHTHDGSNRDLILDFGLEVDKLSEFVTVLYQVYKELTHTDLQVEFTDSIKYNNSAKGKREASSSTSAAPSSPRADVPRSETFSITFEPTTKAGVSFWKYNKKASVIYYVP